MLLAERALQRPANSFFKTWEGAWPNHSDNLDGYGFGKNICGALKL